MNISVFCLCDICRAWRYMQFFVWLTV